jgi:hypothetical protein
VLRINLSNADDPEMRARLHAVRTGFTLPHDQMDELAAAGEAIIHSAPQRSRVFRGQRNPLSQCVDDNTSLGLTSEDDNLNRFFAVSRGLRAPDAAKWLVARGDCLLI